MGPTRPSKGGTRRTGLLEEQKMWKETSTRRDFLAGAAVSGGLWSPWLRLATARGGVASDSDDRQRIEAALPTKAFAKARKPRRLLIFDLNVGYGGHGSIPTANLAFRLMGQRTGAFETVVSRDPSVFKPRSLTQFDAVFFNNNVGNLFEAPDLRESLIEFVYGGGGLMGVHGTTVAFTRWPGAHEDWPEFGIMLGGRGANHRDSDEHVFIKLDDPDNPINKPFGGTGFEYRDEFFRVHSPYSRDRVRVLFSIDTDKTKFEGQPRGNCYREDGDYALAWVRQYGRGRVFYCTIAHNPYVFWDAKMLQFYLAATQFALGDLPAPTTPSAKLTPSVRAQERLGWRMAFAPTKSKTLFEAMDEAAKLGLLYAGALSVQAVSSEIRKEFDQQLSNDELRQIRLKLDEAGVRLLTYHLDAMPVDEKKCCELFDFGHKMGIEAFVVESIPEDLDLAERLSDEHDIQLALADSDVGRIAQACRGRSRYIGACGCFASWAHNGVNPAEAARALRDRLITADLSGVQNGKPLADMASLLAEIYRLRMKPAAFHTGASEESIALFNTVSIELAERGVS
jgi:type 1 glutamine amidotransferase